MGRSSTEPSLNYPDRKFASEIPARPPYARLRSSIRENSQLGALYIASFWLSAPSILLASLSSLTILSNRLIMLAIEDLEGESCATPASGLLS